MSRQLWGLAATLGVVVLIYANLSFMGDRHRVNVSVPGTPTSKPLFKASSASSPCAADGLLTSLRMASGAVASSGQRYLLYAPQFGLSNQLVALRNAVAWAQLLNRTLVLPHLLAHGAVRPRAPFGMAFAAHDARTKLAPLEVIEIDDFLRLGLAPAGVVALATTNKFRPADDTGYFDSLDVKWHRSPDGSPHTLAVPMGQTLSGDTAFSPAAILGAFGGCGRHHQVLAFRSLFAAFDPKPLAPPPPGWSVCGVGGSGGRLAGRPSSCLEGLRWLDQLALPAILKPVHGLDRLADRIAARLTAPDASAPQGKALACAHIRRGDFNDECIAYDVERARPNPRGWVVSHHRNGWGCLQTESELALNLQAAQRAQQASSRGAACDTAAGGSARAHPAKRCSPPRPLAFYASVEDASVLASMVSLRRFNLSSLQTFGGLLADAKLPLPPTLAAILVDQLTCARASTLLLNAFSTFSQLVMGRIGLRHPLGHERYELGWVRDLTRRQQARLGVSVTFWRREDPARVGQLV